MDIKPFGNDLIDRLKLAAAYRCLKIGQAEIVADNVVPIALVLAHSVIAENTAACGKRIVSRHDHSAFAGGDRFRGMEAEGADMPDGPGKSTLVAREAASAASSITSSPLLGAVVRDTVHLGDVAVEMDRHDGFVRGAGRRWISAGSISQVSGVMSA